MTELVGVCTSGLVLMFGLSVIVVNTFRNRERDVLQAHEAERAIHQSERALWALERKDLIDRIQAGSYAELKQQEIRVIKAEKQEAAPTINYSHLE